METDYLYVEHERNKNQFVSSPVQSVLCLFVIGAKKPTFYLISVEVNVQFIFAGLSGVQRYTIYGITDMVDGVR